MNSRMRRVNTCYLRRHDKVCTYSQSKMAPANPNTVISHYRPDVQQMIKTEGQHYIAYLFYIVCVTVLW